MRKRFHTPLPHGSRQLKTVVAAPERLIPEAGKLNHSILGARPFFNERLLAGNEWLLINLEWLRDEEGNQAKVDF